MQAPHPPIFFDGDNDASFERIADQAQGWYALALKPAQLQPRIEKLELVLKQNGHSREEISILACPYPHEYERETLRQYHQLGVDEVILLDFASSPGELESLLEKLAIERLIQKEQNKVNTVWMVQAEDS